MLYLGRYRVESARLPGRDYSSPAYYNPRRWSADMLAPVRDLVPVSHQ